MQPHIHLYASAATGGALYALTKSENLAISCFLSGIFTDLDHVLDLFMFSTVKFTLKDIPSHCRDIKVTRLLLVLHSYELYVIGLFAGYFIRNDIYIGILIGMGLHLILDQLGNRHCQNAKINSWFYFISYRYRFGFRKDSLLKES